MMATTANKKRKRKRFLAVCRVDSHRDVGDLEPKVHQCLFKSDERETHFSPNSSVTLVD